MLGHIFYGARRPFFEVLISRDRTLYCFLLQKCAFLEKINLWWRFDSVVIMKKKKKAGKEPTSGEDGTIVEDVDEQKEQDKKVCLHFLGTTYRGGRYEAKCRTSTSRRGISSP